MGAFSLEEIFLGKNNLTRLETPTFVNQINLEYLYLNENRLAQISTFAFDSLSNLQILDLSENRIACLCESSSLLFRNLTSLRDLNLVSNRITSISRWTFEGLSNLENLFLDKNPISIKQPENVMQLCSSNEKCKIFV